MTQMQLKRGDIVRRSVEGAKGFFYPDIEGRAIMVREDCMAHSQTGWNNCQNYLPFFAPCTSFAERDRYDSNTQNMVIWIEKKDG